MRRASTRRDRGTPAIEHGARTQDRRPFTRVIEGTTAPLAAAIAGQAEQLEALEQALATGVLVASADVELAGGSAGTVVVEGTFAANQVGAPVLVCQGGDVDELELELLAFVGRVIDTRQLRIRWRRLTPAPAGQRLTLTYAIGILG